MAYKAGECGVEGCGWANRTHKGYCCAHYHRLKKYGDATAGARPEVVSRQRRKAVLINGHIAVVPLTLGYVAMIDADDAAAVQEHNWHAVIDGATVYALSTIALPSGEKVSMGLHTFIAGGTDRCLVDHADGNGLDNRRHNLRRATAQQNQFNKRRAKNNRSGFKGVREAKWATGEKKWRATICVNRKHLSLGYYYSPEDAAVAYDRAATSHFGAFARLNFGGQSHR